MAIIDKIARGPDDFRNRFEDIVYETMRIQGVAWSADQILTNCCGNLSHVDLHQRVSWLNEIAIERMEGLMEEIEALMKDSLKRIENQGDAGGERPAGDRARPSERFDGESHRIGDQRPHARTVRPDVVSPAHAGINEPAASVTAA